MPSPPVTELPRPLVVAGLTVGVLAVSSSAVLIRLADAPALAIAFWRCALGACLLAPFAVRGARALGRLHRREVLQLLVAGALLALHFALFISALDYTTVASSVLFVALSPLFVGLGSAVLLGEPPSSRTWRGIALAGVGALVVGVGGLGEQASAQGRSLFGDGLALGGAVAVAGYLLVGRAARRRLPALAYSTAVYAVAAVLLLPAALLAGAPLGVSTPGYPTATWVAIAALVIGPQLLGHTVFNTLLSTVSATVVAVAVLAEPVGASVLAFLVLGEAPGWVFLAGAPIVLAGVWLAATPDRRRTASG